jgi:fumarate hydratase, class II
MSTGDTRTESDTMGAVEIQSTRLWGAQTQRGLNNFPIGTERLPFPMIRALALAKKAAALANTRLKVLEPHLAQAIISAADQVLTGTLNDQFPLPPWQSGSGTHSNMNMNEVLANLSNQLLGQPLGSKSPVHPNDHVNRSQSTNDTFPTAMHVALVEETTHHLLPALECLSKSLRRKASEHQDIIKTGRTHLQDAVPLSLGQEIGAWATQVEACTGYIRASLPQLLQLAQGGTAVGTGINAPKDFDMIFCEEISTLTELPFTPAPDKFAALASHDALVAASGALNTLATSLLKITTDLKLLGSGPRLGLGELRLPANEPGSSIMPGKVNPTQAEALAMVCCQVMGNHHTVTMAGSQGQLQLNAFKPVMSFNLLQSVRLLGDATQSFTTRCINGLSPNREHLSGLGERSLMLVTALAPHIGYDRAAEIAQEAASANSTLKSAALASGYVTEEEFDAWVNPGKMIGPT